MRYFVLILFLITCLFLYSCAPRQEAPIIAEAPQYQNATNETVSNNTVVSNETESVNNQTPELPENEVTSEVFSNNEENATVSENSTISENSTNSTKKDKWSYWRLYGRGTPPLLAIFFNFDDYSIREDMWGRIKQNAKYLLEHPNVKVQLQGNCDERGTNEYNMALGAKRALEVKKMLVKLGIDAKRISTISFGEEKPLAKCHNETCWAINRRVDFVILK